MPKISNLNKYPVSTNFEENFFLGTDEEAGGATVNYKFSDLILHLNEEVKGKSAYELAVEEGFVGTEEEWLESLNGSAAVISVGTVTTVNPDQPVTITNSGTSSQAIFDFSIPKGEKGKDAIVQYTDGSLAGDIAQRVDLIKGISEDFREVFQYIDGSVMDISKIDNVNFIEFDGRFFQKTEKELSAITILPISTINYTQKLILTVSQNGLSSGNLRLTFDNIFFNISIDSGDSNSIILNKIKNAVFNLPSVINGNTIEFTKQDKGNIRFEINQSVSGLNISQSKENTNASSSSLKLFTQQFNISNYTYIIDYSFDLKGEKLIVPINSTIVIKGEGRISNGEINGNNTLIILENDKQDLFVDVFFTGTFKKSHQLFQYDTIQNLKDNSNSAFPSKVCQTNGFWFPDDGGGAMYILDTSKNLTDKYPFFESWYNGSTVNGKFVYIKHSAFVSESTIYAKLLRTTDSLNIAHFGVKYDAKFYNVNGDKKWYSNSNFTSLATDNYTAFNGIQFQLKYFLPAQINRKIVVSDVVVVNQTVNFESGVATMELTGDGYVFAPNNMGVANIPIITSNEDLDVIINATAPGFDIYLEKIGFFGCGKRIKCGLIYRNGGEVEAIRNVAASQFGINPIVCFGQSSSFKMDTVSLFDNKGGLLITNKNPIDGSEVAVTADRLMSFNRISGDRNDDGLIIIDEGNSQFPTCIQLRDIKAEGVNKGVVVVKTGHIGTLIKIDGIVNYPDSQPKDFEINNLIVIEDTVAETPTIEMANWINISNNLNYDILDYKNNKQILFPRNRQSSPHIIYKDVNIGGANGFMVFENGNQVDSTGVNKKSGTTSQRPSIVNNGDEFRLYVGFEYFDTTLGMPIWISDIIGNIVEWVDAVRNTV